MEELQLPEATAFPAESSPDCLDLGTFSSEQPQLFYLKNAGLEELADCFAVVEGVRLPLHSQVLSMQSSVLRECFLAIKESRSEEPANLSETFEGMTLQGAACFLRLLYSPEDANARNFASMAGVGMLAAVVVLSVKLDTTRMLDRISSYLAGSSKSASIHELFSILQLPKHHQLSQLQDQCLALIAGKLATAGKGSIVLMDEQRLAAFGADTLARLLLQSHYGSSYPLPISNVCGSGGGKAGGFTFMIDGWSARAAEIQSPPVEIGGVLWRVRVYTTGWSTSQGKHMSVYLWLAGPDGKLKNVRVHDMKFTLINQTLGAQHHVQQRDPGTVDVFSNGSLVLGFQEFVDLSILKDGTSQYIKDDRLLLHVEFTVGAVVPK